MAFLMGPERFSAVEQFYANFRPTSDRAVIELLRRGPSVVVPGDPSAAATPWRR
jgi:predicted phosphoribosyltransferase